jgi:hypothetical protein
MFADELAMLRANPSMRVKPHGEFGDYYLVSECDSSELDAVANRNVERALERALRNKNATTEA